MIKKNSCLILYSFRLSGFLFAFTFFRSYNCFYFYQEFSTYLKILAAYMQPNVIAGFLRNHIQMYSVQEDEFCRLV